MSRILKKSEVKGIIIIFILLVIASHLGYQASFRMERDTQRNLDVSAIRAGLELYRADYGFYPKSSDSGKIIACEGPDTGSKLDKNGNPQYFATGASKPILMGLVECEWGKSSLLDINDINYPMYLSKVPSDPRSEDGYSYKYISNGEEFQILGSFEGKSQKEYDSRLKKTKIDCGERLCNFGKASLNTNLYEKLSTE